MENETQENDRRPQRSEIKKHRWLLLLLGGILISLGFVSYGAAEYFKEYDRQEVVFVDRQVSSIERQIDEKWRAWFKSHPEAIASNRDSVITPPDLIETDKLLQRLEIESADDELKKKVGVFELEQRLSSIQATERNPNDLQEADALEQQISEKWDEWFMLATDSEVELFIRDRADDPLKKQVGVLDLEQRVTDLEQRLVVVRGPLRLPESVWHKQAEHAEQFGHAVLLLSIFPLGVWLLLRVPDAYRLVVKPALVGTLRFGFRTARTTKKHLSEIVDEAKKED